MKKEDLILRDLVAFRSYARYIESLNRRETMEEIVNRSMIMHLDKFGPMSKSLSKDIIEAHKLIHDGDIVPSMRTMQFSGKAVEVNNSRCYNCSYLPIIDQKCFSEIMFLLLSGCGVGYSVKKTHILNLPKIRKPKEENIFIIHDSIEGWSQAVDMLFDSYFNESIRPIFDYSKIRLQGSRISTTGAAAPGPESLKKALSIVEHMLKAAIGRRLSSIEVHDIICVLSDAVLAGGVRRSALISLFDYDDNEMLTSKCGEWWIKYPWRARANNSVHFDRNTTTKEMFMDVFNICKKSNAGEPGFAWTNHPDVAMNPCFHQDTEILIRDNNKIQSVKIKDLIGKTVEVWDGGRWVKNSNFRKTATNQNLIKIHLSNGESVTTTFYHEFITVSGDRIEARDLIIGEQLMVASILNGISKLNADTIYIEDISYPEGLHDVYCTTVPSTNSLAISCGLQIGQCAEISLEPFNFCNLTSINQTTINNKRTFYERIKYATFLGTLQAAYTHFPYLSERWNISAENTRLLGVSFTGIADNPNLITNDWLVDGAQLALTTNESVAKKIGIKAGDRITTVKPEGSTSVIMGSSSGIHPRYAPYYIRRIRINKDLALAKYLKSMSPQLIEDCVSAQNTVIFSCPQASPNGAIIRNNESALQLFERVLDYNINWIKTGHRTGHNYNNTSCTLYVRDNEWETLAEEMWNRREDYNGISILPYDGGSYKQAPFEEISKEKYEEMLPLLDGINIKDISEDADYTTRSETVACGGGSCEII